MGYGFKWCRVFVVACVSLCGAVVQAQAPSGIKGGGAPLELALAILIPAPYSVRLDSMIPKSAYLKWSTQSDWRTALREAAAPGPLGVSIDPEAHVVTITAPPLEPPVIPVFNVLAKATGPDVVGVTVPVVAVAVSAPVVAPKPVVPEVPTFVISPADRNFRVALARWAKASGWTFEPEHWTVGRDISIGGAESFTSDFKTAVRSLLRTTLLGDLPSKPCFYSNKVVRVVAVTELCAHATNTN